MCLLTRFTAFLFLTITAISTFTQADIVSANEYPFPLKNPLVATLSSLMNHSLHQPDVVTVEYRKDREHVATLEGRNLLQLGLFAQKNNKPAPLMFVISGLGGDALAGSTTLLADEYNAMGYHAVTLPNPFSWGYVLGVSETTLPGYMPRDAHEYYQFLKFVVRELKAQRHLNITGFAVSGYSMGGLVSAFVMNEDNQQHQFNFQKALIINPAYDMNVGISRLDSLYHSGDAFTNLQKSIIMGHLQDTAVKISQMPNPIAELMKLSDGHAFTDRQLSWVIGDSFRESLSEVILTSQQIHELGVLKVPMTENFRGGRVLEARSFSFIDYMKIFVVPSVQKTDGIQVNEHDQMNSGSLYALNDMLKNDSRVYIFENADDLIVTSENIESMHSALGNRFFLYPSGGHIGNLWFERNQKDLFRAVAGLK